MTSALRLAWLLTRGSDRREWWRVTLTALGAVLATGFALAAVTVASIEGQVSISYANGLLDQPGERSGITLALLLLLLPVMGFLAQCARIGAVHRDRRLAALRLAGATPRQVRRIDAMEAGLACLAGSALATVFFVLLLLRLHRPSAVAWAGFVAVAVAVPVLAVLVSMFALRRVVASPLGWVRRTPPRAVGLRTMAVPMTLAVAAALGTLARGFVSAPLAVAAVVGVVGVGAVWLSGAGSAFVGRRFAARARRADVLIAAERLRQDPWATARTHGAVLLVTVVGTGFVGIREVLLETLRRRDDLGADLSFYTTGINLAGAAVLVALAITLSGLAVGSVESVATRRRELAAQAAAGVPREVLGRALLLETALPLAPAVLIAGAGGMAVSLWYAGLANVTPPLLPLVVPVVVYAGCLLAAVTSLPLLRRSVHPAELRRA